MITARRYFRAALLLHIAAPLLAVATWLIPGFPQTRIPALLLMSLGLGGVPYLPLAWWLWWRLGRLTTVAAMRRLSLWAPVLHLPLALAWTSCWIIVPGWTGSGVGPDAREVLAFASVMAVYVLGFGYAYVLAAHLGYALVRRCGWVKDAPAPEAGGVSQVE